MYTERCTQLYTQLYAQLCAQLYTQLSTTLLNSSAPLQRYMQRQVLCEFRAWTSATSDSRISTRVALASSARRQSTFQHTVGCFEGPCAMDYASQEQTVDVVTDHGRTEKELAISTQSGNCSFEMTRSPFPAPGERCESDCSTFSKETTEAYLGTKFDVAVITVPAYFYDSQLAVPRILRVHHLRCRLHSPRSSVSLHPVDDPAIWTLKF